MTWYICAIGSCTASHERPRLVVIEMPPSCATAMRLPFVASIQMSWWSPPGTSAFGGSMMVFPPSSVFAHAAVRKYASFALSGDTAIRL